MMLVLQRLQMMVPTPPTATETLPQFTEPLSQFADTDSQPPLLHMIQPMDNLSGHYDELIIQTTTAFETSSADSEMVVAGSDMGVSDFGFAPLDVPMSEDGMPMPDLLSTLSTDIAHLLC